MYKRIKDLREDHDFTQQYVAQSLGLYLTTYSRYERGEREIPFDLAICISTFYNVSLDYLAGLTDTPRTLDGRPYQISKNITIGSNNGNINIKN